MTKDILNQLKNIGEIKEPFFHRVLGVETLDIEDIYESINEIFYLVEENKSNKYFKFMESKNLNILENNKIKLGESINNSEVGKLLNLKDNRVLNLFDYENNIETFEKLYSLIQEYGEEKVIVFYGDIKYYEVLFLYYKYFTGASILYFSTNNDFEKLFVEVEKDNKYGSVELKENTFNNIEFPKEKLINRKTEAYMASKEIDNIMYNENSSVLKPFCFDNHNISNINLITTYEELRIILGEEARVRPKFSYDDENIYIPNIVAKISGVEKNLKDYKATVKELTAMEGGVLFDIDTKSNALRQHGPLSKGSFKNYCNIDGDNVYIDIEKFATSKDFPHSFLKLSAQKAYLDKINYLINSENIFKFTSTSEEKLDMALSILKMSFPNICEMLHSYNYYEKIPKVFIYSSQEIKPDRSKTLSILISFMNLLAFDVILFVPSGYTDVERYLNLEVVTIHKLATVEKGLTYKAVNKKGFIF